MLLNACKDIGLAVNKGKTKYMEIGRHRGMIANEHIKIGSNSYEKVKTFKYSACLLTNQNYIQEEINVVIQFKHSCLLDFSLRINLPLFSTVFPSNSCCFCPIGLSLL